MSMDAYIRQWDPVILKTQQMSKICPGIILLTVSILWSHSSPHHFLYNKASIADKRCAIALTGFVQASIHHDNGTEQRPLLHAAISNNSTATLGWNVIFHEFNSAIPISARRLGKVPKIQPKMFFPDTQIVVYVDAKVSLVKRADDIAADLINFNSSVAFAVFEHPISLNLHDESLSIQRLALTERFKVDSVVRLREQVDRYYLGYSKEYRAMLIESQLIVQRIYPTDSHVTISHAWLQEYFSGCDRDQVAFTGAFAKLNLKKIPPDYKSSSPRIDNRSGLYHNSEHPNVLYNILPSALYHQYGHLSFERSL